MLDPVPVDAEVEVVDSWGGDTMYGASTKAGGPLPLIKNGVD